MQNASDSSSETQYSLGFLHTRKEKSKEISSNIKFINCTRKPIVEKIRRDRINASIDKLKTLLCQQMKERQPSLKLEKADILEVTVHFLKEKEYQSIPWSAERYNVFFVSWVCPVVSSSFGHAQSNSPGRCSGIIPVRCLSHLSWFLSKQRSSGSTLSPSRISELLTLSLRLSPATLWRKLVSATCIRDLMFSLRQM
uniref:BHLH domain-containing protein n=1 Tax=Paramormyrops kingsleyae TaxID=1676925 RepID=A0A3B3SZ16_9TELE